MGNQEKCIALIKNLSEYKFEYALAYLQGLSADDSKDNAYC